MYASREGVIATNEEKVRLRLLTYCQPGCKHAMLQQRMVRYGQAS